MFCESISASFYTVQIYSVVCPRVSFGDRLAWLYICLLLEDQRCKSFADVGAGVADISTLKITSTVNALITRTIGGQTPLLGSCSR